MGAQVCEGSWFSGFGLEVEAKVTMCMGFVLLSGLWLPPECGLQLALALVQGEQELPHPQSPLLVFGQCSVFSVGAPLTEAAFPSAPLLGAQEPYRGR